MSAGFFPRDEYFMRLALREAERALEHDDVPIGAVIVHEGEVLAAAPNERELRGDPTAHAEMLVLRAASEKLGGWRLLDTVLYVTLEPCAMCAGAIVLARVPRVVFGTDRSQGRRGGQRVRHPGRAAPQPPPRGGRAASWPPRPRTCCAPSSPPAADSSHSRVVPCRVGGQAPGDAPLDCTESRPAGVIPHKSPRRDRDETMGSGLLGATARRRDHAQCRLQMG